MIKELTLRCDTNFGYKSIRNITLRKYLIFSELIIGTRKQRDYCLSYHALRNTNVSNIMPLRIYLDIFVTNDGRYSIVRELEFSASLLLAKYSMWCRFYFPCTTSVTSHVKIRSIRLDECLNYISSGLCQKHWTFYLANNISPAISVTVKRNRQLGKYL